MGKGKREVLHGLKIVILRWLTNTLNPLFNYIWLLDLFIYLLDCNAVQRLGHRGFYFGLGFVYCFLWVFFLNVVLLGFHFLPVVLYLVIILSCASDEQNQHRSYTMSKFSP